MKMNTVLGEIDSALLGETLFHEHVACVNPAFYNAFGDKWFPREKVIEWAVKLFKQAKEECGISTIIDGTPIDLGNTGSLTMKKALIFDIERGSFVNGPGIRTTVFFPFPT